MFGKKENLLVRDLMEDLEDGSRCNEVLDEIYSKKESSNSLPLQLPFSFLPISAAFGQAAAQQQQQAASSIFNQAFIHGRPF